MESKKKLISLLSSLLTQLTILLTLLFSEPKPKLSLTLSLALTQELTAAISRKRPRSSDETPFLLRRRRCPDPYVSTFLMTSSTFEWLAGSLEPLLDCRDPAGAPLALSPHLRLAVALRRLSSGADFSRLSQQFSVSESAAKFCSNHLCRVLCTNFRFLIDLLSPSSDLRPISEQFESFAGIPNCCGALRSARFVGGTVAAQVVADSSSRILALSAAADCDDREILRLSGLFKDVGGSKILNSPPIVVNGVSVDQYVVGGGNHPLLPWLMVPFLSSSSVESEECFDEVLERIGLSAARAVASLRNWGVLRRPMIGEDAKIGAAYVGACSILHNALIMREDCSAMADESEARSLDAEFGRRVGFDLEDDSVESRAFVVRRALAEKAKEFRDSKRS